MIFPVGRFSLVRFFCKKHLQQNFTGFPPEALSFEAEQELLAHEFGDPRWMGTFFRTGNHGFSTSGYGSIPINTIFRGMNIHLPAILMFTRGTRF